MPKLLRVSAKVRRTGRKKIHERIETVLGKLWLLYFECIVFLDA